MTSRDDVKQMPIYPVLLWLKRRGDPRAFDRVRLKMLGKTLKERVSLDKADDQTLVSQDYYAAFVEAVADVTGEPFNAAPALTIRGRNESN